EPSQISTAEGDLFILCVCYRKTLPAPMISRRDYSVLGIVKKCIGMELSKITMPIMFNKPLSFLRRMPEYTEHTHLIHKACILSDSIDCMQVKQHIGYTDTLHSKSLLICRTGKSFNPLLVETNELTRYCLGYRLISEQVSHHPPINTFHAQSLKQEFEFHGSLYPKLKFWGKSVEVEPKGTMTLDVCMLTSVCVYMYITSSWENSGFEQYGTVEIINHNTGDKCMLNFKLCGTFGKELHKVGGHIQTKSKKRCVLYGKWTECMYSVEPKVYEASKKSEKGDTKKNKKTISVIPGKCHLRPDVRAMDNGDLDTASVEKDRLEEKQRAARKEPSKDGEEWSARWFQLGTNPHTGSQDWLYTGDTLIGITDCHNYYGFPNLAKPLP
uniref:Oxysterol binding protein like 2 n=1 Tax=Hucho hucho TaxID=62062 RepID=A0A4W5KW43_9TELE